MRTPLQKEEKVLLITHRSWLQMIVPALLVIVGFVASWLIGFIQYWGWIAAAAGLLYFLFAYWNWKVDIWVVTNYRVIDETGLINHFAKESPLEKINNVSYDQNIWGRIFNYGHVEIQTAAEIGATDYFNVHQPKRLKDTITLAQSEYKNLQLSSQAKQMAAAMGWQSTATASVAGTGQSTAQNIASELEKLFQLKQQGILSEDEYNKAKNNLLG
ncbi:PH domain-containing protein [Paraflavitalea speifideaquila]|uniref:PH domain-containing protein n=1 Tax=Paraflavitalea speifideaquila TaxID=3076558 RepID=UPI0028EEB455|nr:PH domain-containing protein [Paraflavitalea speifideiaquila]